MCGSSTGGSSVSAVEGGKMPKIIISPGYGAGWSTWAYGLDRADLLHLLTFPPLIEAIEKGEDVSKEDHPAVKAFKERFPDQYLGGLRDAEVVEVPANTPFYISEYDGSESLHIVGIDEEFFILPEGF